MNYPRKNVKKLRKNAKKSLKIPSFSQLNIDKINNLLNLHRNNYEIY